MSFAVFIVYVSLFHPKHPEYRIVHAFAMAEMDPNRSEFIILPSSNGKILHSSSSFENAADIMKPIVCKHVDEKIWKSMIVPFV